MLDHTVGAAQLLPGTAHIELYRALASALAGDGHRDTVLRGVTFVAPLELKRQDSYIVCDQMVGGAARVGVQTSTIN